MDIATSPDDADRLVRTVAELAGSRQALVPVLDSAALSLSDGATGDPALDLSLAAFRQAWAGAIGQLAHDARVLAEQIRLVDARYADTELHLTHLLAGTARDR